MDGCSVCEGGFAAWQLQAACNLGAIKEELGVSVTVVVSMCDNEMKVHGAPPNWSDDFNEPNVCHVRCQLDDITVEQPQRSADEHKALQKERLSTWKGIFSSCGSSPSRLSLLRGPETFCFIALVVVSTAALLFCVLGSLPHIAAALKKLSAFCSRSDLPLDRGDIETTLWMRCGW